jgi:hypothetical protein
MEIRRGADSRRGCASPGAYAVVDGRREESLVMRRSFQKTSLLALALLLPACAGNGLEPERETDPTGKLGGDLAVLATQCTFVAGVMTVTVADKEVAQITKRTADSAILANGEVCNDGTALRGSAPSVTVTKTSLKKLAIVAASGGGSETVLLDFTNGVFASGAGTATTGITVDLGGDAGDQLIVNGTSGADTIVAGASGFSIDNAKYLDITLAYPVSTVTFSLGDGNDVFSSGGDTLIGGASNSAYLPGAGGLVVYGGQGNDVFKQGTAPTPGEVLHGDAGTDTVDYSKRTMALSVSLGTAALTGANDGDGTYGSGGEKDDVKGDVEIVLGGDGNDTLSGLLASCATSTGCVTLNGGAGDDVFDQAATPTYGEVLIGGAGTDTVDYHLRSNSTQALAITMDGLAANDGEANEHDNVGKDIENVVGGAGNDTITGNVLNNVIKGGPGADVLSGDDGDDVFDQGSAADGADTISGGKGNDTVDYSARADADIVAVLDGATSSGAVGEGDRLGVSTGGVLDLENLWGSRVVGRKNSLTGNALSNELWGGPGNDSLVGGAGDDVIDGGATAAAGSGKDDVDCGTGLDVTMNLGSGGGTKQASCEL